MTADIPLAPANVRSNLWNVALLYATQALRLVEKEIAVAGRRLRILVDGDDDRLDVLIAPAFTRGHAANFLQRLQERRRVAFIVEPSHYRQPPEQCENIT